MQSLQVVTPGMVSPDLVGLRDLLDTDIFSLVLGISSAPPMIAEAGRMAARYRR